jgi:hypothetical protein
MTKSTVTDRYEAKSPAGHAYSITTSTTDGYHLTVTVTRADGRSWDYTNITAPDTAYRDVISGALDDAPAPRRHQLWCHQELHDLLGQAEPDCQSRYIAPGNTGDSDAFAFLVGPADQTPQLAVDAPHGTVLDLAVARAWLLDQLALIDGALASDKWPGPVPAQASKPCAGCGRTFCGGVCNGGQH